MLIHHIVQRSHVVDDGEGNLREIKTREKSNTQSISDPDHGLFSADDAGHFDVPDELGQKLVGTSAQHPDGSYHTWEEFTGQDPIPVVRPGAAARDSEVAELREQVRDLTSLVHKLVEERGETETKAKRSTKSEKTAPETDPTKIAGDG